MKLPVLLIILIATVAEALPAKENGLTTLETSYLDIPTFRTGETGPLPARIVVRLKSDDIEQKSLRAVLRPSWSEEELAGPVVRAWPGIPAALEFPVALDHPRDSNTVLSAMLEIRLGGQVAFSRQVFVYVRESGMYYRTYRSRLDDTIYPYALYLPTDTIPPPEGWPLVLSLHGAYSNHANNMRRLFGIGNRDGEPDEMVFSSMPIWPELPAVPGIVVCPWGRGTMGYHGPGARDVLDVLTLVRNSYPVNDEKVTVTGLSMGGNGTWEMSLRHPDIFAAAVPVCPPADMEINRYVKDVLIAEKQAHPYIGQTLRMNNIVSFAPNARSLGWVHIHHGNDDPVVPVTHSETMVAALEKAGVEAPLDRYDNVGHNAWDPAYKDRQTLISLLGARKPLPETEVFFTTCLYENSRYAWLDIERFAAYGDFATVRARWDEGGRRLSLETGNVALLALDLLGLPGAEPGGVVTIGGFGSGGESFRLPQAGPLRVAVKGGDFKPAGSENTGDGGPVKRRGLEGPIYQAVSDRVLLVYGTRGSGGKQSLRRALRFADWGELPDVHFMIRADSEVSPRDISECHLVLFGDEKSNSLIARINGSMPVRFDGGRLLAGGESFDRNRVSAKCVFPNPLNPERLVLLNFCEEWDYAHLWSFQAIFKNLPDYFIYRRGGTKPFDTEVLKAGFFDGNWNW